MCHLLEERLETPYLCPVCGVILAAEPAQPTYDAPCSDCGYPLWCRERTVEGVHVLDVLPDRTPEHSDIARLADALTRSRPRPRVVVDLSALSFINSSLMARLVALKKRLEAARCKLVLCGLTPFVREVFAYTQMEKLFRTVDSTTNALRALRLEVPDGRVFQRRRP